ncbi:unnamed protein product [Dicrocoelium dendriticum]|nr:unnamed protein product [Dicrocoelium dendriticum]
MSLISKPWLDAAHEWTGVCLWEILCPMGIVSHYTLYETATCSKTDLNTVVFTTKSNDKNSVTKRYDMFNLVLEIVLFTKTLRQFLSQVTPRWLGRAVATPTQASHPATSMSKKQMEQHR